MAGSAADCGGGHCGRLEFRAGTATARGWAAPLPGQQADGHKEGPRVGRQRSGRWGRAEN